MSRLMRGPDSASAANHRPVTRAASPSRAGQPLAAKHLVDHLDEWPLCGPSRTPQPLERGRVVDPLLQHQHPFGPLDPGAMGEWRLQLLGQPPLDLSTDRLTEQRRG
jgi:hypothetical protein